ncbi:MAG TPA: tyrosine-type recombinase/integrase [Desulfobacteraceae bacterium]|nr:tyrosine-type recombinase/integrase [Desulfobacteraceae bacterium]
MAVKVREKVKGSGVWWVFVDHRGKRKAKKIGTDKKFAIDIAKKIEAKLTLGDLNINEFNKKCPTLKEYARKWLAMPHKRREGTQANYTLSLEKHVLPVIGDKELKDIKQKDLKEFFNNLQIKGMATNNFKNIKAPLNQIFKEAVTDEIIQQNPLTGMTFSNKRNIKIQPLTEEQAIILLDQIREYDITLYPHFLTLLSTGVRIGELCGLKWGDIDFDNRFLTVERQVSRGQINPTKNGKSRKIDMPTHLVETLKVLKTERKKDSLKNGRPFCDWVFTFNGRDPITTRMIKIALDTCLEKAELPHMRVHDLRHSYATIRIVKGDNIADVSYQMGHSSINITIDTYTTWIPGKFKDQVNNLFSQPAATKTQPDKIAEVNI